MMMMLNLFIRVEFSPILFPTYVSSLYQITLIATELRFRCDLAVQKLICSRSPPHRSLDVYSLSLTILTTSSSLFYHSTLDSMLTHRLCL